MSDAPVFLNHGTDAEMEKAFAEARKTFRFFWREIAWERRRIIPGLSVAAVKACLSDPPEVHAENPDGLEAEHMWLSDVDFDGRRVTGTLLNTPHSLKSYSEGDSVEIAGKQLSDWMYVVADEVCGGFTIDVMRARMSKSERKQHDNAWGLNFGDVGVIKLIPQRYLGPEPKKGWFSRAPEPEPQTIEQAAAIEHPMSVNMRDSLDEAITKNPEMLTETDIDGFTFLHQLALAGSVDGVEVCLKHNADPTRPAKNGMTPYMLAKSLGWTRVMKLLPATSPT